VDLNSIAQPEQLAMTIFSVFFIMKLISVGHPGTNVIKPFSFSLHE
jgi:hypothetical protein